MTQTISTSDHFIIWPSSDTLTFNLPEQMLQMPLLLLGDYNCAKLFWNPCIVKARQIWTDAQYMHIHQTETATTMSRSPQAGSTKMKYIACIYISFD